MNSVASGSIKPVQPSLLYSRLIWLIYAVAVILRIWRYTCGDFSGENAIMGQMSRDWLFGETPLFFYGQSHMGSWDTLLSTPLIAIFGPSAWIINLWPPILSMGVMLVCHRLLKSMLPPAGVVAGLLYFAVPPTYWMFYSGYAQTHNTMCILLEAVLMLLTISFWREADPKWWLHVALGFISGAGFYLNFQMGVGIAACALFILLFTWRKFRVLKVAAAVGGAAVGLLPLIIFELQRGGEHIGAANSFFWQHAVEHWRPFLSNALPIILGFNLPAVQCKAGASSQLWGVYLILCVALLIGVILLIKQGISKSNRQALLPVMIGLINIAVVLFSVYGNALNGFHQTYLFSLYLLIPFALGAFVSFTCGNKIIISLAISCLIAGLNFYNYDNFCVHNLKLLNGPFHLTNYERTLKKRASELEASGAKSIYMWSVEPYLFYVSKQVILSNPYSNRKAVNSYKVDMDLDPLFYDTKLHNSMKLLGLEYQSVKVGGNPGQWHFKLPLHVESVLDLPLARAKTMHGEDLGEAITDHDVNSYFTTQGKAKEGQGFVLDLGEVHEIAGFSLIPDKYNDSISGLKVEAAGEDGAFHTIRSVANYWGPFYLSGPHPVLKARHPRADCYFPVEKIRYLRLSHIGDNNFPWTVRDILVFGPDPDKSDEPAWISSIEKAIDLIKDKGLKKIYADTWAAAWIKIKLPDVFTIAGNVSQDSYGHADPPLNTDWMLHAEPGAALLVEPKYSGQIISRLAAASIPAQKAALGALDLISLGKMTLGTPLDIKRISSNVDPDSAEALLRPGRKRWTDGKPQGSGAYLELDLGGPSDFSQIILHNPNHPDDYPRNLKLECSSDGVTWRQVSTRLAAPLCFSGQILMTKAGKMSQFRVEPEVKARYLRLKVGGNGGPYWWSVEKIEVFSSAIPEMH